MPSNSPPQMSKDELFQWCARRLGGPRRDLTDLVLDNYEDALEAALRWFSAKKGLQKQKIVSIYGGKNSYNIFNEIGPDVDTILSIDFQNNKYSLDNLYSFGMWPGSPGFPVSSGSFGLGSGGGYNGGNLSSYLQSVQYLATAEKVLSADPDFTVDDGVLYIFPIPSTVDGSAVTGQMLITYKTNDVNLDKLNERNFDLVKRYTLAFLKKDLGVIRDRYGSTFTSANGMTQTDGARFLKESEQEMAQLNLEIELSGFPLALLVG